MPDKTAMGTEKYPWERSSLLHVCTGAILVYKHQARVGFFSPKTIARKRTVTSCAPLLQTIVGLAGKQSREDLKSAV